MLKWLQKYLYVVIGLAVLLPGFAALQLFAADAGTSGDVSVGFRLEQGAYTGELSLYDARDGKSYLFLPSYGDPENLTFVIPRGAEVTLGDQRVVNGMSGGAFEPDTGYTLCVDGRPVTELYFCRSANVATVFIDTGTGDMTRIHGDKEYSENIRVTLVSETGTLEYTESRAYLKGRGNYTWLREKKPYLMTCPTPVSLLGMGEASKWVLLANDYDPTNLNNKLIMDLADRTGTVWSPEGVYVDVYLNGAYNGLYLLAEKPEVGETRLDLKVEEGDFLCRVDLEERWDILSNPFMTGLGRTVEIISPRKLLNDTNTDIQDLVARLEEIIVSGGDLSRVAEFDLDSWVRRYLIDEISGNIDADLASSYFYYDDGVFYAGPVWDYDLALGNSVRNLYPGAFIAKTEAKSDTYFSPYYSTLYENDSFYQRMVEIYRTEFRPILMEWTEGGVAELAGEIGSAAAMDRLRWPGSYLVEEGYVHTPQGLEAYLKERVAFLDSAWLEGREYCTVQLEAEGDYVYRNLAVEKGTVWDPGQVGLEAETWYDKKTGQAADFTQPILSDCIFTVKAPAEPVILEAEPESFAEEMADLGLKGKLLAVSLMALVMLFAGFVITEWGRQRMERRRADAAQRDHVSP